jgi:hypothetical protein
VVQHHVDDDLHPPSVRGDHEGVEVGERAVLGVDLPVIEHVVAVVARGGMDGHQPDRVHLEVVARARVSVIQRVEVRGESGEVPDAVAIRVGEAPDEDLVEDLVPPPPLRVGSDAGIRCP